VRAVELLGEPADDDRAGGVRQPLELVEVLVEVVAGGRPLERRPDEQRALDGRREGDEVA
jgi:hypothetical protein